MRDPWFSAASHLQHTEGKRDQMHRTAAPFRRRRCPNHLQGVAKNLCSTAVQRGLTEVLCLNEFAALPNALSKRASTGKLSLSCFQTVPRKAQISHLKFQIQRCTKIPRTLIAIAAQLVTAAGTNM
jgi:hypothetical protein